MIYIKSEAVQSSFEENRHVLDDLGIDVSTLPAISFRFKNQDQLRMSLENPEKYAGLILTSSRTVEAIHRTGVPLDKWMTLRNYCVGQTTRNKIDTDLGTGWTVKGGADTGNAELLSDLMLSDLTGTPTDLPFLFPCSNLALGTLVTRLATAGQGIESIEVYETIKHEELDEEVTKVDLDSVDFILFFSPSTVHYFLDSMRKAELQAKLLRSSLKLIAIGPSTRQEMLNQGLTVFAACEKPNIESLIEIINQSKQPSPENM